MAEELSPKDEAMLDRIRDAGLEQPVSEMCVQNLEADVVETGSPRVVASTMLAPFTKALKEQGHPYPAFGALLKVLRLTASGPEQLQRRLDLPLEIYEQFEGGVIHPAWFPRPATLAAARVIGTELEWRRTIREALAVDDPAERSPSSNELAIFRASWVHLKEELEAGLQEEVQSFPVAHVEAPPSERAFVVGNRVRALVGGEVGVVIRVVSASTYEVALPSGQKLLRGPELERLDESPLKRLAELELGRTPLFEQRLQARYLWHSYRYDELGGLTNARIEPKEHQVFVAWRVLNKVRPRMILADEVGLGKTIEAGLILKELEARKLLERVLIVTPASLIGQWAYELKSKFNMEFEIYDGPRVRELRQMYPGRNVWTLKDRILCSLPFARRESTAADVSEAQWDAVVFDEAHHVRRHRSRATQAYRLVDSLRFDTYGMLLLTATPMQLDSFELFSLVELIEPGLFAEGFREFEERRNEIRKLNDLAHFLDEFGALPREGQVAKTKDHLDDLRRYLEVNAATPEQAAELLEDTDTRSKLERVLQKRHPLVEVMVRNRKVRLPHESFPTRDAESIAIALSDFERDVYQQVNQYIREGFNRAIARRNMTAGFLMVAFQKMLTSSSHALARSFGRRIVKLGEKAAAYSPVRETPARELAAVGEVVDGGSGRGPNWHAPRISELTDAEEQSAAVDEALAAILEEDYIGTEIQELQGLVNLLDQVQDSKLTGLERILADIFAQNPDEKVLIFTQFVETQLFLRDALADPYRVQIFNGRQRPEEKDRSVQRFRERDQILISTEAGGEGRNFQFAHIIVNYDLPWNPMRVEQRIGRVDRIGQKSDRVIVRNLFLRDTLEERVLTVLQDRINVFEESVGGLDPILGNVEDEIRRIAFEVPPGREDEAFRTLGIELEEQVRRARAQQMDRRFQDFLMDRSSLRWDEVNRLMGRDALATHEDLERFVHAFLEFHGGSVDEHAKGGDVLTIPVTLAHHLRSRANRVRGTFSPVRALEHEELEFLAIGNDLIDRILRVAAEGSRDNDMAAHEALSDRKGWGIDFYYRMEVGGVRPTQHFIRHRWVQGGTVESQRLTSMPILGRELRAQDVQLSAEAIQEAIEQSELLVQQELEARTREMEARNRGVYKRELERSGRIHEYRRKKEQDTIQAQQERLERIEYIGTAHERRLLPAIRGRIQKARERLERVELDYQAELDAIETRARLGISYEFLGAAIIKLVQADGE